MNEAVTKRFLLYFRLMMLVWILIANAFFHVIEFDYSWLVFLSNIMLFTMEGDIKDRFLSVELGGLVGMVLTVLAMLAIAALTPVLGGCRWRWCCSSSSSCTPMPPRCSTTSALPTSRWPASTRRPLRPTCPGSSSCTSSAPSSSTGSASF